MTAAAAVAKSDIPPSERGPSSTKVVISYGFWLFLLSDIIMFAAMFAAYAVLVARTAGGPTGGHLFDRQHVLIETGCLLASSFSCGVMSLAISVKNRPFTYAFAFVTFLLGAAFLGLEVSEFAQMIQSGSGPSRSAFLSAFFALVGLHGIHVATGLCWLIVMMLQLATLGLRSMVVERLVCFSLFWHALDIVWIGVFTIGLSGGEMTDESDQRDAGANEEAPGESPDWRVGLREYATGLIVSIILTLASFWVASTSLVWAPGVPILLAALAIGQMGVHLVFFLHISSGPEGTNNILALAFGVFVVALLVFGSIIIMANLDANMLPSMGQLMRMQR